MGRGGWQASVTLRRHMQVPALRNGWRVDAAAGQEICDFCFIRTVTNGRPSSLSPFPCAKIETQYFSCGVLFEETIGSSSSDKLYKPILDIARESSKNIKNCPRTHLSQPLVNERLAAGSNCTRLSTGYSSQMLFRSYYISPES